jgi:hypothetical protein
MGRNGTPDQWSRHKNVRCCCPNFSKSIWILRFLLVPLSSSSLLSLSSSIIIVCVCAGVGGETSLKQHVARLEYPKQLPQNHMICRSRLSKWGKNQCVTNLLVNVYTYIGSRLVLVSLSLSPHIAILHKEPYSRLLYFAHGKGGKGAAAARGVPHPIVLVTAGRRV